MASRSLNRVILIGNLTRDPELKYTPNGTAVCTFGIATNRSWATTTGEIKEDVQFHRIVSWQKLAELSSKLLTKGRKVYLEGRIIYRTYTGKDGIQRTVAEIVMDDFILFDDRGRQTNNMNHDYQNNKTVNKTAETDNNLDVTDDLTNLDLSDDQQKKQNDDKISKKTKTTKTKKEEEITDIKTSDTEEKPAESEESISDDDIPF